MNVDYKTKMEEFEILLKWTPKEMIDLYVEIFTFVKYHTNLWFIRDFNPSSEFNLKIADAKQAGVLYSLDFVIGLFQSAYPDNYTPMDTLLDKPVKEVNDILNRDYELRKREWEAILRKLEEQRRLDEEKKNAEIQNKPENN